MKNQLIKITSLINLRSACILFLLFILNNNIYSQQGWQNLNVSFGGVGIYFKDVNTGIIGGYRTTNAGNTWNLINFGAYMSFPDQNTGYSTAGGLLFKTTNFGDTYVMLNNPSNRILKSINFPNVNTGYACGESGTIIKTTSGGLNWFIANNPLNNSYYLFNIFFTDAQTGYVSGLTYSLDTSVFMKTTDGGNNWNAQYFLTVNWGLFTAMFFTNTNTGYIGAASRGYILKTTNSGINWLQFSIPTANGINSIHFPSTNIGFACCNSGQILKTTNAGINWFLQTTGTGTELYSIFFINDQTGYCAGNNNTVLKTTTGGGPPISITPISNEVPADYRLEQNYPNPFNPVTHIVFSIPKSGITSIRIYDALGRLVNTLFDEHLSPGIYKTDWNASQMPSGIYIYKIQSGSFTQSGKMILVK